MTMTMTGATFDEVLPLILDHHYAHRRTADPMFCFAWREAGGLLGDTGTPQAAIIYTAPINRYFGQGAIELARLVRLPTFSCQLSIFVAWSLRWLRQNTDLRYCLSYADQSAGHHGGIYQALNFMYVRESAGNKHYHNELTDEIVSGRSFDQRRPEYRIGWTPVSTSKKYLYVAALNEPRRKLLKRFGWEPLPYPKPDAVGPVDERLPSRASLVQPEATAPVRRALEQKP